MQNPFTTAFGIEPQNTINRNAFESEIVSEFSAERPSNYAYMITGVRGAGKTVMLASLANIFREKEEWIVVDLNTDRDMLSSLAAALISNDKTKGIIDDIKLSLSLPLGSLEITNKKNEYADITLEIKKILEKLSQNKKRVLVVVDEVVSNASVKQFASQFQIYLRQNLNIFLIMAGLYDNINKLQNEKTLTFLYRTPRIELAPLNCFLIQQKYKEIFNLEDEEAKEMAETTKGYPYAFQALGYLCFKMKKGFREVLSEFDAMLEDYCYDKIFSELSEKDVKIVRAMADGVETKVETIREKINMSSNEFTVYRKRLIKKGIIKGNAYGRVEFCLPRFAEFVMRNV